MLYHCSNQGRGVRPHLASPGRDATRAYQMLQVCSTSWPPTLKSNSLVLSEILCRRYKTLTGHNTVKKNSDVIRPGSATDWRVIPKDKMASSMSSSTASSKASGNCLMARNIALTEDKIENERAYV